MENHAKTWQRQHQRGAATFGRRAKSAAGDRGLHETRPEEHHMVRIERAEPRDHEAFRVKRDSVDGGILRQTIVRALDDRGKDYRLPQDPTVNAVALDP